MNFSKPPGSRFSRRAPRTLPIPVLQAVKNAKQEILTDPLERLRSVERKIKANPTMPKALKNQALGKVVQLRQQAASVNKAAHVNDEEIPVVDFSTKSVASDANKISSDANKVAKDAKAIRTKRIVFALMLVVVVVLIVRSKTK